MLIRFVALMVVIVAYALPANAFEFDNLYVESEIGGTSIVRSHDDGLTKRDILLTPSIGFGYQQSRSFRYGFDVSYYSNTYPAEFLYISETEKTFRTTLKVEKGLPMTRDLTLWAGAGFVSELSGFSDRFTMTNDGYLDEQLEDIEMGFGGNRAQGSVSMMFAGERSFLPFDMGFSVKVETGFKEESTSYFVGLKIII